MTKRSIAPIRLLAAALVIGAAWAGPALGETPLSVSPSAEDGFVLRGPDARLQLVVTRFRAGTPADPRDGREIDVTSKAAFAAVPSGVVQVDASGFVTPLADGEARISAVDEQGSSTETVVRVERFGSPPRVSFPHEITPIFTKFGCNGGGCHGKVEGQNGFRLSLLGFEPAEDYEWIVKEAHGRRVFPAAPEFSLLLRKATGEIPHGGGGRIEPGSPPYRKIVRWIEQGMSFGDPDDPVVKRISVIPDKRIIRPGAVQQLRVEAHLSDGRVEDVTRVASFETNVAEMAECDESGLVSVGDEPGAVAIMIRYQGLVDVAELTVPLGAPIDSLPAERNFIDRHVFAKLRTLGLPPSAPADDATFLRRVTLDVAGRLPTPAETDAFLASADAAKRDRAIERLLDDPGYPASFAAKWNALLRNRRDEDGDERGARLFHAWIERSIARNEPFDELARAIVTASGSVAHQPAVVWYRNVRESKDRLQDVAQVFLGVRLQCAQCHHHPYERWSQQDYYGFEAFFRQLGRKAGDRPNEAIIFHRHGVAQAQNPKTGGQTPPTPLGVDPLEIPPDEDPRGRLADWMADPDNPFFARMLANRYWKHFFGRGLVEPEDDIRVTNPATHPELLDEVADCFVASGFDMKALVRLIVSSQTYQLSSVPNAFNDGDRQNYSRFYPRRLPAEVLSDAIDGLTGKATAFDDMPPGTRAIALPDNTATRSSYFLSVFGRPEMNSACECERSDGASLAQTLHLLNSKSLHEKLAADDARAAAVAEMTDIDRAGKIRMLYVAAFSREPTDDESAAAAAHIDRLIETASASPPEPPTSEGGQESPAPLTPEAARRQAFEDIIWALLNTREFLFNH